MSQKRNDKEDKEQLMTVEDWVFLANGAVIVAFLALVLRIIEAILNSI